MLEKTIGFRNGIPVKAKLASVEKVPLHIHQTIEFILVLEGILEVYEGYQSLLLKDGDIHIFNSPDLHGMIPLSKTNTVLTCYIDTNYLKVSHPDITKTSFLCDCVNQEESSIHLLRQLLADIYFHYDRDDYGKDKKLLENDLNRLVALLSDRFQFFYWHPDQCNRYSYVRPPESRIKNYQAERLHHVEDYLYTHYSENISLNELANYEYLNTYYLSHFIRQMAGLSYQQWLSAVRSEWAEKLLVSSAKTITEIAFEVGFNSSRAFIAHFKNWYGYTPSKYREVTALMHSHLPHKYSDCDIVKAEKLLDEFRCEGDESDYKIETSRLDNYLNLFILSCELYETLFRSELMNGEEKKVIDALREQLQNMPTDLIKSYAAFLSVLKQFGKNNSSTIRDDAHHKNKKP